MDYEVGLKKHNRIEVVTLTITIESTVSEKEISRFLFSTLTSENLFSWFEKYSSYTDMDLHPFKLDIVYNQKTYSGEKLYQAWISLGFVDLLSALIDFIIDFNKQTDLNLSCDETVDFGFYPIKTLLNYQVENSQMVSLKLIADYFNSWEDLEHFGEGVALLDFIKETPKELICISQLSYLVASLMCSGIWYLANYSYEVLELVKNDKKLFYTGFEEDFKFHFLNSKECFRADSSHKSNVEFWTEFFQELKVPEYSNIIEFCNDKVKYKHFSEYRKPCPCHFKIYKTS